MLIPVFTLLLAFFKLMLAPRLNMETSLESNCVCVEWFSKPYTGIQTRAVIIINIIITIGSFINTVFSIEPVVLKAPENSNMYSRWLPRYFL